MAKATAVAFLPGAYLIGFEHLTQVMKMSGGEVRYLNCKHVKMDGPFLRMEPMDDEYPMAIFVSPAIVAWMLESSKVDNPMGFVPG